MQSSSGRLAIIFSNFKGAQVTSKWHAHTWELQVDSKYYFHHDQNPELYVLKTTSYSYHSHSSPTKLKSPCLRIAQHYASHSTAPSSLSQSCLVYCRCEWDIIAYFQLAQLRVHNTHIYMYIHIYMQKEMTFQISGVGLRVLLFSCLVQLSLSKTFFQHIFWSHISSLMVKWFVIYRSGDPIESLWGTLRWPGDCLLTTYRF